MSWLRRVLGGDRRGAGAGLPAASEVLLAEQVQWWAMLDVTERARLLRIAEHLVGRKRWESARGFDLTDEVRVLIAAHAARLVIGLDRREASISRPSDGEAGDDSIDAAVDAYDDVGSIIVHRSTVHQRGDARWSARSGGIVRGGPMSLDGQAHQRGPVLISWGAARREIRRPGRGYNVIYHEFAHKLDMVTPLIDGTPLIADDAARQRWVDVCSAEFERVKRGDDGPLRAYAGTNPAEFFAVATEVFFDRPLALADERPELYDVLRDYYGQDTADRQRRFEAEIAAARAEEAVAMALPEGMTSGVGGSVQPSLAESAPTTCDSATGR